MSEAEFEYNYEEWLRKQREIINNHDQLLVKVNNELRDDTDRLLSLENNVGISINPIQNPIKAHIEHNKHLKPLEEEKYNAPVTSPLNTYQK